MPSCQPQQTRARHAPLWRTINTRCKYAAASAQRSCSAQVCFFHHIRRCCEEDTLVCAQAACASAPRGEDPDLAAFHSMCVVVAKKPKKENLRKPAPRAGGVRVGAQGRGPRPGGDRGAAGRRAAQGAGAVGQGRRGQEHAVRAAGLCARRGRQGGVLPEAQNPVTRVGSYCRAWAARASARCPRCWSVRLPRPAWRMRLVWQP